MTPTPLHPTGRHQRSTYKLLDKLLSATARTSLELLSTLVHDIVETDSLVMTGGRVWELDSERDEYILRYQEGEMEFLSEGTRRTVDEMPAMKQLSAHKTLVAPSTVPDERGHRVYSLTGVGDPVKRPSGTLYPYALAFTARELTDEFTDAMLVTGSAATTAIRNMNAAQRERRIRRDLDQAWEIQRGLVPDHATSFRDYDIYGISVPESVVGGDYFDYLTPTDGDDRLTVVISDAASKGLPAAVQALFVSGALRMGMSFNTKISSLIQRLNGLIYDTFPFERFVTLFYCELTPSANGLVLYANAGHCAPFHYKAASGSVELLQPTGGILGIVEDQPFGVENVNMAPGDILLLYTDGITEAQRRDGSQYGEDRLRHRLLALAGETAQDIARLILEEVQTESAGGRYSDDKTLVVIKRTTAVG